MRYVRQVKKNPKRQITQLENKENDDLMEYNFPELEEYFVYTPGNTKWYTAIIYWWWIKGIKMTRDSVTYCTSGLVDRNKGSTLSWLHKVNQTTQSVDDD